MNGSEFVNTFSRRSLQVWEQAALDLARQGSLAPWPYVDVTITDGNSTLVLPVQSDVIAVGTLEDYVRLPLTPNMGQAIANLSGALLPTPWIEYAIWRAATLKLDPVAMAPNQGASLEQYAAHSRIIDEALRPMVAAQPVTAALISALDRARIAERNAIATGDPDARAVANDAWLIAGAPAGGQLVAGIKKGVVIANFYKPGKVLLFGWYRRHLIDKAGNVLPELAPDVFDDGKPMGSPNRQPIQPKSNVHGDFYVDYSHGIRLVGPVCRVNGQPMSTAEVYQHPEFHKLVNPDVANGPGQGGPIRTPRYPAPVPPAPVHVAGVPITGPAAQTVFRRQGRVPYSPDPTEIALNDIARRRGGFG